MCLGSHVLVVNEILQVIIDRELKFNSHVKHICHKAGNKLNFLARTVNILSPLSKNTFFRSLIKGKFDYSPVLWIIY